MSNEYIKISDLRKVKGMGSKTIERIEETLLNNEDSKNYISKYNEKLHLQSNDIYLGDCLELMNGIKDKSIDMILCDLPYGTTACKWDEIISFDKLWRQYNRIVKDNGAIVLFNDDKFGVQLKSSNFKMYKYDWIWKKSRPTNFMLANKMPMKYHEMISVFYKKPPIYNKQPTKREGGGENRYKYIVDNSNRTIQGTSRIFSDIKKYNMGNKNPSTILNITEGRPQDYVHPTQKPVALLEYLIKTYTNEGELVLDNCIGSGSTAVACLNTNRQFIGIEKEVEYYEIAKERINKHMTGNNL